MSGRGGWVKPSGVPPKPSEPRAPWMKTPGPGRPPKQPDVIRCPDGSWWLLKCYQQDREAFTAKAEAERPRMQRWGMSPDPLVWK